VVGEHILRRSGGASASDQQCRQESTGEHVPIPIGEGEWETGRSIVLLQFKRKITRQIRGAITLGPHALDFVMVFGAWEKEEGARPSSCGETIAS
jgi:hypothetical protein